MTTLEAIDAVVEGRINERRRCVGLVLAEVGRQRLLGHRHIAEMLDVLATQLEHPERTRADLTAIGREA